MNLSWVLNIIENGDLCSSVMLLLCLSYIGQRAIESQPDLVPWGARIGLMVLLAYVVFQSPIFAPTSPEELLLILLRGMLAAAYATTLTWILLPVAVVSWRLTGRLIVDIIHAASAAARRRQQTRHTAKLHSQERQRFVVLPEPLSPEQVQQQREAEALTRVTREAEETAKRRREEARLRSELFYERHARQLAALFPRERFDLFVDRYMGGATDAQLVEQREQLLREMILDSLGTTTPPKFASMTELSSFFAARREEINALPHSDDVKDAYTVQLNKQEDEALKRFLKP